MTESTLSTFTASDGDNLAVQDWPLDEGTRLRGVVLLVHGLGEHAGRYDALARQLNAWGYAVRGYDQFGHGESGGPRGMLPHDNRLVDDLVDVLDATRTRLDPRTPLILLGHSMGGLVAALMVARGLRPVEGLVLSSPALDAGLSTFQKLQLAILPRWLPNLAVHNGLDTDKLSHDAATVQAYCSDPLVHSRITPRLGRFIARGGPEVQARAPQWAVPTLLLYAGDDRLVNPDGSRAFGLLAAQAPAPVHSQRFDGLYHEIFNETPPARAEVLLALKNWLHGRF